jgi:type II secretion system protein J
MRPSRGFTLIELVVAIIIAAVIAGAVAGSLSQLGKARDVARIRMTATRRAVDALEHIRRDVQSVLRSDDLFDARLRLSPESMRSPVGALDRDQMLLFSTRLRPIRPIDYTGEGEEYETQYRIEDDRDGSALWRRRAPVPDEYEDAGGIAEAIGDGVIGVRFEAYDGSTWTQEWDSDIDGLPVSIRATVTASGVRPGEDALADARSLSVMRTEIPIDRVAPPKPDPATLAAQAAADAAAQGGSGGAGNDTAGAGARTGGAGDGRGTGNMNDAIGNRGGNPGGGNRGGNGPGGGNRPGNGPPGGPPPGLGASPGGGGRGGGR